MSTTAIFALDSLCTINLFEPGEPSNVVLQVWTAQLCDVQNFLLVPLWRCSKM